ncbi:hypothetical protein [Oceanithermus sp.]|uniref:SHOCT-like domain-containing protein n=1 Tax=Oceanithermus sp. TaxID=2268145 RepID=UPI002600C0F1|nr:hypothetical protein [Oceanithermus sp.]
MNEERQRILQLLSEGKISAAEAERLLEALEEVPKEAELLGRKGAARLLRIHIDDPDSGQVRVNLPLALARFALKFIPKEQQRQISEAGFDLDELLTSLQSDTPEGKLVEIQDARGAQVLIEVV